MVSVELHVAPVEMVHNIVYVPMADIPLTFVRVSLTGVIITAAGDVPICDQVPVPV